MMNRRLVLVAAALAAVGLMAGCSFRPLSPEEKIRRLDRSECEADANAMIGSRFYNELAWDWYFERCMKQKGYTPEQIREMWR